MDSLAKPFLDGLLSFERLSAMKNLLKLGVLLTVSGLFSSCGIPMSAVRTAQNSVKSLVSAASNPLGN